MSNTTVNKKNIVIIELSEFSVDLLTQAVALYPLPNLKTILQFKRSSYKTNDRCNGGYLTPYAQWTSIHTGVSAKIHRQAKPDSPCDTNLKYFWQVLTAHNISIMHEGIEPRNTKPNALPRFSQRYKTAMSFFKTAYKLGCTYPIFKEILKFRLKPNKNTNPLPRYITWLDYMSGILFCKMKQKYKPQCSILFLDSLAYCQSYHWQADDHSLSSELIYNLQMLDTILGQLITHFPDDNLIIHNALSQIKTNYEQREPTSGNPIYYTGRLIALGTIYSQELNFPNHIFNHEFNHYIYNYFVPEHYKLKSEYIEDEILETLSST